MSSILQCTCFAKPQPPPPPSSSSLSCSLPHHPCGAKRLFRDPGGNLVCMAYGLFYHVALCGRTLCLFVSPTPSTTWQEEFHNSSIPPVMNLVSVKVTTCFLLVLKNTTKKTYIYRLLLFIGCCLLLHGFIVALKSFPLIAPLTVHADPGWLPLSPIKCQSTDTFSGFLSSLSLSLSFCACLCSVLSLST